MDKKFFLGLFTGGLLMFMSFSLYFPQISEAIYSIPPTPAFKNVTDGITSISASNYTDRLFLTEGQNMTLQYFQANNTIRFSSTDLVGAGGGWLTVYKTADETIQSDSDLTDGDDTDLRFSVISGENYAFWGVLWLESHPTADFKYDFLNPGATAARAMKGDWRGGGTQVATSLGSDTVIGTDGTEEYVVIGGYIEASANGELILRWSQNSAQALDTTLKESSFITWRQLS